MQGNQIGLFRLMRAPSLIHAWFGAISPFSRKKETNTPMEPGESLVPCILQLPPEIQYLFFGFLNPKELCTASLVCWYVFSQLHKKIFWYIIFLLHVADLKLFKQAMASSCALRWVLGKIVL